ncbi:MAG: WecB/TagA/CpsF family glycosyltransferase [Planctomycetota bacterium]
MNQTLDRIEALVERRTPSTVLTANLNFCMLHEDQPALQQITRTADLVIADGQPIVWRSRLSETPLPERVAGSELVVHLARLAAFRRWRIYLLGGQAGVPEQAAKALLQDNPSLEIVGTESPPFRDLTDQEQAEQIARIRAAKPDLLLVAFGQPKGDYWIDRNRQALGVPVCIQVGASLDFLAGTSQRAPLWVQVIGMEWAHRMMGDPRRLVPRYAANALFAAKKLTQDWREQVTRWGLGNWTQQPSG